MQLGLVDQQTLINVADTFVPAGPNDTLADHLKESGALDPELCNVLDTLVSQVEKKQGSMQNALDAFGGDELVHRSFGGEVLRSPDGKISVRRPSKPSNRALSQPSKPSKPATGPLRPTSSVDADTITTEHPGRYAFDASAEVGRGGIGRVLVAVDQHLGREVAIKELLMSAGRSGRGTPDSSGLHPLLARFLREARVTAQLEHPNIIPAYELGRRVDGTIYYTMKLVRGRTLKDALEAAVDLGDRLKLLSHFTDLCNAVAYAHSRGVIHRDIKPENVMVGEFGETVVLDWGLAKVRGKKDIRSADLERNVELMRDGGGLNTVDGSAMGTPAFMSPEQARGHISQVDERSDIWSLGVVLFQLLTGALPFRGKNPLSMMLEVVDGEIPSVRDVSPEVSPELAAVVDRALQRDSAKRYKSAKELAEEIEAFRSGEMVAAYEYSGWELLTKYVTKHRAAFIVLSLAIIALIGVAAAGYSSVIDERDRAVAAEQRSRHLLADVHAEKARAATRDKRWANAELFAAEALSVAEHPDARGLIVRLADTWRPEILWQDRTWGECVAFATSSRGEIACATVSRVRRWDANSGAEQPPLTTTGWVRSAAYTPDGASLIAGTDEGSIAVWDVASATIARSLLGHRGAVVALALSHDGSTVASADRMGALRFWDTHTAESQGVLPGEGTPAIALAFSPLHAHVIAVAGQRGWIEIWDRNTQTVVRRLMGHSGPVQAVAFAPHGHQLASAGRDGAIRLWGTRTGDLQRTLTGHRDSVQALIYSSDGNWLYSGGSDGGIHLWEVKTGQLEARFDAHEDSLWALALSTRTRVMVTSGANKQVRAWRLPVDPKPDRQLELRDPARALAFSGDRLVVAEGREIIVIDTETDQVIDRLKDSSSDVDALELSKDGRTLLSGGTDGEVIRWSKASSKPLGRHEGAVRDVAISNDDRTYASAGDDGKIMIFVDGAEPKIISGHEAAVTAIDFSPDGAFLVSGSWDKTLRFHEGDKLVRTDQLDDKINALAFSPDGQRIAVASDDGVRLVRAGPRRTVRPERLSRGRSTSVDFSADGVFVAATNDDGHLSVWRVSDATLVARIPAHRDAATSLAWWGDELASAGRDRTVHIWAVDALGESGVELLEAAEGAYRR